MSKIKNNLDSIQGYKVGPRVGREQSEPRNKSIINARAGSVRATHAHTRDRELNSRKNIAGGIASRDTKNHNYRSLINNDGREKRQLRKLDRNARIIRRSSI